MRSIKNKFHYSSLVTLLTLFAIYACPLQAVPSPSVNATAILSRNRVAAGEIVQLDLKVTGVQEADVPPEIAAEGLQIKLTGQSSEMQMINLKVSSSVIYSYIVIPLKSGNLTIPPISIRAKGEILKTTALPLTVIGTGTIASNITPQQATPLAPAAISPHFRSQQGGSVDRDRLGFAEMVIPQKRFYVGEVVPVTLRFYVDAHYGFSMMAPPNFGGEGFLTDRFKEPEESRENRGGTVYTVATFRTLLTAVKPGVFDLPAATWDILVAIPEAHPVGMDADLFSRLLGGRSPFVREHKMTLKTGTTHCEVLPLPTEGCPKEFSGAIGEFHLEGSVAPQRVDQGDPVTLSLKISGKGNFQALKGPQLNETQGWRTYPPVEHFESTDVLGWRGVKNFETTMIAQQPVTRTPGSSFSYFDPIAIKYVTLTTAPLPLEITNTNPASSTTVTTTPAVGATATSSSSVPKAITAGERLIQKTQHSWKDPLHQKAWVIAWLTLLSVAIASMSLFASRAYMQRKQSPRSQERHNLEKLMVELQEAELSTAEFYDRAAVIATWLLKQGVTERDDLEEILRRRDEIQYGARIGFLTSHEKKRFIAAMTSPFSQHRIPNKASTGATQQFAASVNFGKRFIFIFLLTILSTSSFAASTNNISETASPEEYYNEALAEKEKGDLPAASLALRRALILDPTLFVAQQELKEILPKMGLQIESSWQRELASHYSPEKIAFVGMVIGWSATLALIAIFFLTIFPSTTQPKKWGLFFSLLSLSLIGHALSILGVLIDPRLQARYEVCLLPQRDTRAMAQDTPERPAIKPLRAAPTDIASVLAQLPTGSCLVLLSQHGAWSYVRTTTGQQGWISSGDLESLIPKK